jgi:hypothetical protein
MLQGFIFIGTFFILLLPYVGVAAGIEPAT